MPKTSLISVSALSKTFGANENIVRALHDVNLNIEAGEMVVFFGPSGSGKSTLLNILAGLEEPSSGQVVIDGQHLSSLSDEERASFHRDRVGMVFQAYNLIPCLTVSDNISLPLIFSRHPKPQRVQRVQELLTEFKLKDIGHRLPTEISGGQQQRVGIMRALAARPPIIIADEPTGNLDSQAAEDVMQIFIDLNKQQGTTLLIVTHNPQQLVYADHIFYLLDGQIIRESRPTKRPDTASHSGGFAKYVKLFGSRHPQRVLRLLPLVVGDEHLDRLEKLALDRLVKYVGQRLKKEISRTEFRDRLDWPLEDDGVGLYKQTAAHVAEHLEIVVSFQASK